MFVRLWSHASRTWCHLSRLSFNFFSTGKTTANRCSSYQACFSLAHSRWVLISDFPSLGALPGFWYLKCGQPLRICWPRCSPSETFTSFKMRSDVRLPKDAILMIERRSISLSYSFHFVTRRLFCLSVSVMRCETLFQELPIHLAMSRMLKFSILRSLIAPRPSALKAHFFSFEDIEKNDCHS